MPRELTREMAAEEEKKVFANHGTSLSAIATVFAHPLTYVKVLVQVVLLHLMSQCVILSNTLLENIHGTFSAYLPTLIEDLRYFIANYCHQFCFLYSLKYQVLLSLQAIKI